jgi:L-alanine-DL-glutamate epimerase-like enolase superfamily enzyme
VRRGGDKVRITGVEVRCCRKSAELETAALRSNTFGGFEFLVVTLSTDEGLSASTFGFAGRSADGSGRLVAETLRPFFLGREAFDRERAWHDFRTVDRWWGHLPIYAYGPFDVCLWLLGAQAADQPLYRYLGAYRDAVPTYASSMVLPRASDYGREAEEVKRAGLKAYKLHPPGRTFAEDIEAHHAAREAVGGDFTLMSDPVGSLNLEQAIRLGRALERLDYHWLEEPLHDEEIPALRELTRVLDIPVVGTEVLAKHPYSVAECISTRVVDRVRADVSWTGGVTGVMKTARTAEAFGVNCEIHTAIFQPLELVNLHCCAAIRNCEFFEVLYPLEAFSFGLAEQITIQDGLAHLPQAPGLGIELDWNEIDRLTVSTL